MNIALARTFLEMLEALRTLGSRFDAVKLETERPDGGHSGFED